MRTILNIACSVVLGIVLAVGIVRTQTTVYRWNPELEFTSAAEFNRRTEAKNEDPNAKIEVGETLFDFGIMDKGDKGRHTFTVRNVGTAVLSLKKNATTCTCTGIDIEPDRVPPGRTAKITLHWDADRATGKYKQGGTVLTNDPSNKEIAFSIQGLFISSVLASPSSMVLPSVSVAATKSVTFRLYGYETPALHIARAEWPDKEHFDITFAPGDLTDEDRQNDLFKDAKSVVVGTITLKPGLPLGPFQQKFVLATNFTREPKFEYTLSGQIFGDEIAIGGPLYHRDTGILMLGKTVVGKNVVRDFSVSFSGTAAGEASLAFREASPSWLKVSVSPPRDGTSGEARRRFYTVTVEIPTDAPVSNFAAIEGGHTASIVLDTGLKSVPSFRIPLQFTVERL